MPCPLSPNQKRLKAHARVTLITHAPWPNADEITFPNGRIGRFTNDLIAPRRAADLESAVANVASKQAAAAAAAAGSRFHISDLGLVM